MHNSNTGSPNSVAYSDTVVADTIHRHRPLLVINVSCGSSLPIPMDIDWAYNSEQYETDLSYNKRMCQPRGADHFFLHVHKL